MTATMNATINAAAFATGLLLLSPACGGGGSGGQGGGTPITERPSRALYDCRVDRGVTDHAPRLWDPWPVMTTTAPAVGPGTGTAFLGRLESMPEQPFTPSPRALVASTFAPDGTLGPSITISPTDGSIIGALAMAPRADGFAAVWVEGETLRFAAFDGAGQAAVAPRPIAEGVHQATFMVVPLIEAGADGGFAVAYNVGSDGGGQQLYLLTLGADGEPRGAPRLLVAGTQAFGAAPARIAAAPDGYALVWGDPNDAHGEIRFARTDLAGAEIVAPRTISVPGAGFIGASGFSAQTVALVRTGDAYLAAWSEGVSNGDLFSGASATVYLVRIDAAGNRLAGPTAMRAATADVDEVDPSLIAFGTGGAVAVLWARGSHIYACAGCVPDHRIDLLLVDPVDLVPLGNVVTINAADRPNAGSRPGGLLSRTTAVLGSSILTAFNITFHVSHTSASASFACD